MAVTTPSESPQLLFRKRRVSDWDQAVFTAKVALACCLAVAAGYLALSPSWPVALTGALLLGATYTHMVELQHQCLHHSAFQAARLHRWVGVPLGIPLLVTYSHYRVRHLQHHRYLGTPQDSEFFGFDNRKPITPGLLVRGLLDYSRLVMVLRDVARSWTGRWSYDIGQIAERRRREIVAEYRLIGLVIAAAVCAAALGLAEPLVRLWLLPLAFAVPLHFLVEVPEHLMCETSTRDVLRNTRSIRGSWLTTWFTNGNNLHIEHHAAMVVPINRLRERHQEAERRAVHVERSYGAFFRKLVAVAWQNRKEPTGTVSDGAAHD
ncbi:fatty acid desaturase family protein [Streptomyces sp. NPDC048462]|uniref:fatty acid desaturase family protein n=1 Tax=Streptomyces sp. NPDC048462 TaxID=3365555 RepID=UPI00371504B7